MIRIFFHIVFSPLTFLIWFGSLLAEEFKQKGSYEKWLRKESYRASGK
jgi:hypothetical protein